MRRLVLCVVALAFVLNAVGCNSISDKYQDGREQQNKKADKMMEDNSE